MIGRIIFLCLFILCISCTSTKMGQAQIQKEFKTTEFELDRPMYFITHLSCGFLKGVYEDGLGEVEFVDMIDSESLLFSERYKSLSIGDKNCKYPESFLAYDLLNEGTKVKILSIKDVLNASWWFWEINGVVEMKGRSRPFEMKLGYEEDKPLRSVLSEVFRIEK